MTKRMTERQYYNAVQAIRTTGWPDNSTGDDPETRVWLAACMIIRDRLVRAGKLGPDDDYSPTADDVKAFFAEEQTAHQWNSLKQIADGFIEEGIEALH